MAAQQQGPGALQRLLWMAAGAALGAGGAIFVGTLRPMQPAEKLPCAGPQRGGAGAPELSVAVRWTKEDVLGALRRLLPVLDGCADTADALLPFLRPFFKGDAASLFLDVGSHVGDFSEAVMALYADRGLRALQHVHRAYDIARYKVCRPEWWRRNETALAAPPLAPRVVAVEMLPSVFQLLRRRAQLEGWDRLGFSAVNAAASDTVGEQRVHCPSCAHGATLVEWAFLGDYPPDGSGHFTTVPTTTVDRLVDLHAADGRRVWFLHIDANGHDPRVLRGAERALAAGRVEFLDFEYSTGPGAVYDKGANSLRSVVGRLGAAAYRCFMALYRSPARDRVLLLPLSGRWWHDDFEHGKWANIFCAHERHFPALDRAIAWWNGPPQELERGGPLLPGPHRDGDLIHHGFEKKRRR
eukprot:TRINITY_DN36749_c0_g1_i1.p1 TRINITY_DN36749_c0_g1~~TRINITY_DN36749_c0_g1_i1.p1  ORF type:complete len:412 (+),score=136.95 TRINITY_DN36749_c0_g1_i1:85-1320(+)